LLSQYFRLRRCLAAGSSIVDKLRSTEPLISGYRQTGTIRTRGPPRNIALRLLSTTAVISQKSCAKEFLRSSSVAVHDASPRGDLLKFASVQNTPHVRDWRAKVQWQLWDYLSTRRLPAVPRSYGKSLSFKGFGGRTKFANSPFAIVGGRDALHAENIPHRGFQLE